tara:strand:+ start:182 stop:541 length:360 start_codon:yes stop_codon:yes gene_type:complete
LLFPIEVVRAALTAVILLLIDVVAAKLVAVNADTDATTVLTEVIAVKLVLDNTDTASTLDVIAALTVLRLAAVANALPPTVIAVVAANVPTETTALKTPDVPLTTPTKFAACIDALVTT